MHEINENFPEPQYGDGVSRAVPGQPTAPHRLRVKLPGASPMICTIPAESADHALRYAASRWPNASVRLAQPQ